SRRVPRAPGAEPHQEAPPPRPRKEIKGTEFYVKLGVLASVPILFVAAVVIYFVKFHGRGGNGDGGPVQCPVKPPEPFNPLPPIDALYNDAFEKRAEGIRSNDPDKKKECFEKALKMLEDALQEYRKVRAKNPGSGYDYIDDKVKQGESVVAQMKNELVEEEQTPPKPVHPPEYDQAMEMKKQAVAKWNEALDEKDPEIKLDLLGEAINIVNTAIRRMERAVDSSEGGIKAQAENEMGGMEGLRNTIQDEIDRTLAETSREDSE
ncbi:MAG: hypothetical protein ABIH26_07740, partial [Candidatus Eisenbacteria bacterium]